MDLPTIEDVQGQGPAVLLDELLERGSTAFGLESRVELLEDERVALDSLEPRAAEPHASEVLCTRCRLFKHPTQFADSRRPICRDCE
jgi:hypothetical protein